MPNGEVYFFEEAFERDPISKRECSIGKTLIGKSANDSPHIVATCAYHGVAPGEFMQLVPADNEQGFELIAASAKDKSAHGNTNNARPSFFNEDDIFDTEEIPDDCDFHNNAIYRSNRHYSPLGADTRGGAHFYRAFSNNTNEASARGEVNFDASLKGTCLMDGAKHNNNQALASQAFAKRNNSERNQASAGSHNFGRYPHSSNNTKAAFKDFYTPKDSTNASFVSARQLNAHPTKFKTTPASAYSSGEYVGALGSDYQAPTPVAAFAHNPAIKKAPVITSEKCAKADRDYQESMDQSSLAHLNLPKSTTHVSQRRDYIPTPSAQEFADYHAPYHQAFSHNDSISPYCYGTEYAAQERAVVYRTQQYEQELLSHQVAANEQASYIHSPIPNHMLDNDLANRPANIPPARGSIFKSKSANAFEKDSKLKSNFSKVEQAPSAEQWWRDIAYTKQSAKKAFAFDNFKQTKKGSFIGTPEEFLPPIYEEVTKTVPANTPAYHIEQLDSSEATLISSSTLKEPELPTESSEQVAVTAPTEQESRDNNPKSKILVLGANNTDEAPAPKEGVTKITGKGAQALKQAQSKESILESKELSESHTNIERTELKLAASQTSFADFKTAAEAKNSTLDPEQSSDTKDLEASFEDAPSPEANTTKADEPSAPIENQSSTQRLFSSSSDSFGDFKTANGTQDQVFYRVPVLSQKQLQAKREQEEQERIAREKAEQERLEQERIAREKAEQERLEQERIAREKAEQERLEQERIAREKAEQERLEQERIAREKAEQERLEQERIAAEKAEQERLEQERIAREKAEQERLEQERIAAEKAEQERLEQERIAAEKAKQERLEQERIAAEEAEIMRALEEEQAQLEAQKQAQEAQETALKQAAQSEHPSAPTSSRSKRKKRNKNKQAQALAQENQNTSSSAEVAPVAAPSESKTTVAPSPAAPSDEPNKPMSKSQARRAKQKAKALARAAAVEQAAPEAKAEQPAPALETKSESDNAPTENSQQQADVSARSMATGLLNTTSFFGNNMGNIFNTTMIKAVYTHHGMEDLSTSDKADPSAAEHKEHIEPQVTNTPMPQESDDHGKHEPELSTVPVLDNDEDDFIQEPQLGFEISRVSDYGKEQKLSNVANIQDEEEPSFKDENQQLGHPIMEPVSVDNVADKELIFATPTRFVDNESPSSLEQESLSEAVFMSEAKLKSQEQQLGEQSLQESLEGFKPLSHEMEAAPARKHDAARAVQEAIADVVANSLDSEELLSDSFMSDDSSLEYMHTSSNHDGHKSKGSNSLANLAAELIDDFDDPFEDSFAQSLSDNANKKN